MKDFIIWIKAINISLDFRIFFLNKNGCLHQSLERRMQELEASKVVSIKDSIAWRLISVDSEETLELALFEWRQQVTIMGYDWRQKMHIGLNKKGKIRVQVILRLGIFSFIPKIVMSRTRIGFMFRLRV